MAILFYIPENLEEFGYAQNDLAAMITPKVFNSVPEAKIEARKAYQAERINDAEMALDDDAMNAQARRDAKATSDYLKSLSLDWVEQKDRFVAQAECLLDEQNNGVWVIVK